MKGLSKNYPSTALPSKIRALILLLIFLPGFSHAQTPTTGSASGSLSKKDVFQAEQWLRTAQEFWEVEDYLMVLHYCQMLVASYPETHYSEEANELLKKVESPKANKKRKFWRSNPGLTFGTP